MAVLFLEIQIANALTNLLSELGGLWTAGRPLGNNPDERIVPILFCIAGPETGSGKQLPILRINVAPSKLLQRRISGVEPHKSLPRVADLSLMWIAARLLSYPDAGEWRALRRRHRCLN